jgi:hypothetical protein
MAIEGEKEISVPAVTTNKWWVVNLTVNGQYEDQEPNLSALLRPYWTDEEGKDHFVLGQDVVVAEDLLYSYAATHPEIAQAMQAVFGALQIMAKDKGLI